MNRAEPLPFDRHPPWQRAVNHVDLGVHRSPFHRTTRAVDYPPYVRGPLAYARKTPSLLLTALDSPVLSTTVTLTSPSPDNSGLRPLTRVRIVFLFLFFASILSESRSIISSFLYSFCHPGIPVGVPLPGSSAPPETIPSPSAGFATARRFSNRHSPSLFLADYQ